MIRIRMNDKKFMKDMNNIIKYSEGFLEGVHRGKAKMLSNIGKSSVEVIKEFVDSSARVNPDTLHHVYEWYQTGSPNARLFDIVYSVNGAGLSIRSQFRQSTSIKNGSNVPFYDKAKIMETGTSVTITPKQSTVLTFNDNGEQIFTKKSINVTNPGGEAVKGAFESTFDSFMRSYFSQAFLSSSGILAKIKDLSMYKKNMSFGKNSGKQKGIDVGYRWITSVGV
jgi:hypothetical protein